MLVLLSGVLMDRSLVAVFIIVCERVDEKVKCLLVFIFQTLHIHGCT